MHRTAIYLSVCLVLCPLSAPGLAQRARPVPEPVTSTGGMVVTVSAPASQAGASILARGGNAVDAAVATAFALAVTHPAAGNIGGGGFMMVLPAPGLEPVCIDYRETAPGAATPDMFTLSSSRLGTRMVGVPGTVRGLALAHERFGRLAWNELLRPAIGLAGDGFPVEAALAKSLNDILRDKDSRPYREMLRVFAPPEGDHWTAGARLVQPELSATLQRIAHEGPAGFYQGSVAAALVAEMSQDGGLISLSDLRDYRAKMRVPVHGTYRGYDVFGPPPPSSGGIVLVEMLNILECFDLSKHGVNDATARHLIVEAMRRAYLDRARYLGDADFVAIPAHLTTKQYARQLAQHILPQQATPSESLAPDIELAPESDSTTHFSIVDEHGMAVSNTYTLEQSYGARVMVRGHGFLLNNEMGDFNWVAGHTDREGRIGTEANLIAPHKRMLSSQTPVLVLKDGQLRLVVGSPGGRTIINTVLGVILNVVDFDLPLPQAVAAPRWHHAWLPDEIQFEAARDQAYQPLVTQLTQWGHSFAAEPKVQGDAHCIAVDPQQQTLIGVADTRISGRAIAVPKSRSADSTGQ